MLARKKSGFTLIELLVVIAIIAILAAILFPVFARAREAARKSTCTDNMKQCAMSVQLYYGDYDATLPSSLVTARSVNPAALPADYAAYQARFITKVGKMPRPTIASDPDWGAGATWPQILYDKLGKNKEIIWCPSDSEDRTGQPNVVWNMDVSYWWKFAADRAWNDAAVKAQKETDFGYVSDQVILYEHKGWHFGDQQGIKNDVRINVAYMDTHVRSVTIVNGPPAYTNSFSAAFEPMYYNFDNRAAKSPDAKTAVPLDYNGDGKAETTIINPPPPNVGPSVSDDATLGYWNPHHYSDWLPGG